MDFSKPPPDCTVCNGQREWTGRGREAVCYFCGVKTLVPLPNTPVTPQLPTCGGFIEDRTGTGLERISCSCDRGAVRQPYMTQAQWEKYVAEFKQTHSGVSQ